MMIGQVKIVAKDGLNCDTDTGVTKSSDGDSGGEY